MKFNPGQHKKTVRGVTYIKDAVIPQVVPPKKEEIPVIPPKKEEIPVVVPKQKEEIKPKKDEPIQPEQVEKKSTPKRSGNNKRKPSSKSNRPSNSIS
jgi:hypothetical protein